MFGDAALAGFVGEGAEVLMLERKSVLRYELGEIVGKDE